MALDRIDVALLALLQNDARRANKQLAADVGLAPSSVHERLKRLWAMGVLTGIHAEVDPAAMGIGLEALLMIELAKHERALVDRFLDEIVEIPEVRTAQLITGRYDLIVHVVARDTRHLKDLALDRFTSHPGVTRIETSIIYETRARHELPMLARDADATA
ncbi:Lrp/AsnC family transcriptional regulator [Nitrogeniibacter mangrovi]|uniref:Lrp/AsnC family transcriptional regulator n=1 Tax=Nitrogeniibacter mangrovi TaxID=2016596 RepID=A0A6C1B6G1_9RHOO|nr:Lrp/AsnC family transcriptional regulator [Nitrogeniibacter mangrovi]QID19322.1 Lrp/AsnC family transcriptional regulator [Nitrogeniibacter mangrovi]